jgi:radical SAM protein with 4Fe4S-binding SPASM domain
MEEDDRFYSDSKLLAHMERLDEFSRTGHTKPIQAYLELTNVCNHDCPGCIGFRGDGKATMSYEQAIRVVGELKECGVKAILLTGGGDPTCHSNLKGVLEHIANNGMEAGLITNGQKLNKQDIETIVNTCTFIRISLDADSPETHQLTHGTKNLHAYNTIMRNVDALVQTKKERGSNMTIGFSYLFGAFSAGNLYKAAQQARNQGVNYVRFKPFFTKNGDNDFVKLLKMEDHKAGEIILQELEKAKNELTTDSFFVSYPTDRTEYQLSSNGSTHSRKASVCYVPHFFLTITPDMNVYPCCIIKDMKSGKYALGNLNHQSLKEIWESKKTRNVHEMIDLTDCPNPCQFNCHVELLYKLKTPQRHHSFL